MRKKQSVPECAVVAPRLPVPSSPPLPVVCAEVTRCRSASFVCTEQWWLLCLPLQQTALLAVCPFCKDQGGVKDRKGVSERLFSVSLLDFLAQSNFVMDWTGFCSASRTAQPGPEESTSAEPKGILSAHETCFFAFFRDYVEWDGSLSVYCF